MPRSSLRHERAAPARAPIDWRHHMRWRAAALALATASTLAATGCGSGDGEKTTTKTVTTAASTATTTTGTSAATPTTPTTSTTAADGSRVDLGSASFAVPDGWRSSPEGLRRSLAKGFPEGGLRPVAMLVPKSSGDSPAKGLIVVMTLKAPGAGGQADADWSSFKRTVISAIDRGSLSEVEVGRDTDVGGRRALVVDVQQKSRTYLENRQVVTVKGDTAYYLQVTTPAGDDLDGPRAALDGVRSSWQWK
ncbi:hypothetical protein [Patulibacter medicamentivorans]|nr:hypothetical protein [Patulibacter medicamentivorans]